MAIYNGNEATYVGCVIGERSHMWLDGMEDVFAIVWDDEEGKIKSIKTGYYGADGNNLMGMDHDIDVTPETARKVLKSLKADAFKTCVDSILKAKMRIEKGAVAEVIKGRKVKRGTQLEVFWVGEKPTYKSRYYGFNETETIAGCYDADGNKVWIKADYLKRINLPKTPNAKERKKFIKAYIERRTREIAGWVDLQKIAMMV